MNLKVYGRKSSANVQKVHWLCEIGNINFKQIDIGGVFGGHNTEEFKLLNPNSTIPVIEDEGFILYESNAILKYISKKYRILYDDDLKTQALCYQWIDWSSLVLGLSCSALSAHKMLLPTHKRDKKIADEAEEKIHNYLRLMNDKFLKHRYILNDKFSLADIPLGCWLNRCRILNVNFSQYNGLINWINNLTETKEYNKAVISAPFPPN